MAAMATALMGKVLGHTEAEKAFRPWWDNTSDYILYGLLMVSVILIPTAMFASAPLECNLCLNETLCGNGPPLGGYSPPFQYNETTDHQKNPKYNYWWVKKYCLMHEVDSMVLHLPYILLAATILLYSIEKAFLRMQKGNVIQNKFYALLVDYKILESKEETAGQEKLVSGDELETRRDLIDLKERINGSSGYFFSYIFTQILEFTFAVLCSAYLAYKAASPDTKGIGLDLGDESIHCNVHDFYYECSGHPSAFYTVIILITCGLFLLHAFISFYSLMWAAFPCLHSLNKLKIFDHSDKEVDTTNYSHDFKFLLNLLGKGAGLTPVINTIAKLDPAFRDAVNPRQVQFGTPADNSSDMEKDMDTKVTVELQEPTTGLHAHLQQLGSVSYLATLAPPAGTAMELLRLRGSVRQATFSGLERAGDYTLTVETLVDGQTVGTSVHRFNASELKVLESRPVVTEEDEKPMLKGDEMELLISPTKPKQPALGEIRQASLRLRNSRKPAALEVISETEAPAEGQVNQVMDKLEEDEEKDQLEGGEVQAALQLVQDRRKSGVYQLSMT